MHVCTYRDMGGGMETPQTDKHDTWQHMPVTPAFGRLREEDCPGLRPAWVRDPTKQKCGARYTS